MSSTLSSLPKGADRTADVLFEKLEDPRIVEALVSLLDKSDKLAFFADVLEGFLQRSEGLMEKVSPKLWTTCPGWNERFGQESGEHRSGRPKIGFGATSRHATPLA